MRLRANIEALDAVVFVTPEYNHSIPGVLKNAIDYLPPATLKDKATALIGYSWYGGEAPRAHLRDILSTFAPTCVSRSWVSTSARTSSTVFSGPLTS